jgi:hypothetical protein
VIASIHGMESEMERKVKNIIWLLSAQNKFFANCSPLCVAQVSTRKKSKIKQNKVK